MGTSHANVFLDTSAIIHGMSIEQIDWRKLAGAGSVLLLVPINVIRELDRHKDGAEGRIARKRARAFFSKYVRFDAPRPVDGDMVRDGVRLRLLHADSRVSDPELDPAVGDDRIIAEILAFNAEGRRVVVAGDHGLLLKAERAGLEPLFLPEELQRAPEPDETERKLAEVTRELAQLKNRLPDVRVSLCSPSTDSTSGADGTIAIALRIREPASEQDVERAYDVEASRVVNLRPASPFGGSLSAISASDARKHLAEYRQFLHDLAKAECFRSRTFQLSVQIYNEGTGPASDVYLCLEFPDGFELLEEDDLPELPDPPRLRSVFERIAATDVAVMGLRGPSDASLDPDEPKANGTHVWYRVQDVLHHAPRPLGTFVVVAPEEWAGRGFDVEAMIQTAEHAQPKRLLFHVLTTVEHSQLRLPELVQRVMAEEDS